MSKIFRRTRTGWTGKIENKGKDTCDDCGARLFQAPHGGVYCDKVHLSKAVTKK